MTDPLGAVRGRRRGPAWCRVSYGLHRPAGDGPGRLEDLAAWQLVLPPSGRFTHVTAAELHGWWLPPLPDDLPVFAAMSADESRPQRRELVVSRHSHLTTSTTLCGLRVDPPTDVLVACARHLRLLDMVVLVDAALQHRSCMLEDVRSAAASRRRGAPMLRQALAHADGRSESAWETLLRMLHVSCGIEVEPQFLLLDEEGALAARADLRLRGTTALHEYDGEHHLSRPRQRKDLARARRIGNQTWLRRGYTSSDVLHQAVGVLRDADLSLGREHRPERIRAWHELLADSCFTPSGRSRLLRRLGRDGSRSGGRRQLRGA